MWEISIKGQAVTFLYGLIFGGCYCIFYDIIRAVRRVFLNSRTAVFIEDILFFTVTAFASFLFLLARTNGEIRGYVIISFAVGFAAVRFSVSPFILKILVKASGFIRKIFKKLFSLLFRFTDSLELIIKKLVKKLKKQQKNLEISDRSVV